MERRVVESEGWSVECLFFDNTCVAKVVPKRLYAPSDVSRLVMDVAACLDSCRGDVFVVSGRLPLYMVTAIAYMLATASDVKPCFADPKIRGAVCVDGSTIQLPQEAF